MKSFYFSRFKHLPLIILQHQFDVIGWFQQQYHHPVLQRPAQSGAGRFQTVRPGILVGEENIQQYHQKSVKV